MLLLQPVFLKPYTMPAPFTGTAAPCFSQPASLPLPGTGNNHTRQSAALAIIQLYYNFFGATGKRHDKWLLLTALSAAAIQQATPIATTAATSISFTGSPSCASMPYTPHGSNHFGTMNPPSSFMFT